MDRNTLSNESKVNELIHPLVLSMFVCVLSLFLSDSLLIPYYSFIAGIDSSPNSHLQKIINLPINKSSEIASISNKYKTIITIITKTQNSTVAIK